ncbi:hypothetical protein Cs308_0311 [Candidatus Chlamydia sanziniae]|uniref:Uncharacterized protein n=1 Tax=Candidatus Chlamydia sanziniae TaxID=1806891 RepID=A0A1A9HWL4_9CHLA|nr:hypothetical protein Cs308_0311 [Candidatus Chlamydia sanziniae]
MTPVPKIPPTHSFNEKLKIQQVPPSKKFLLQERTSKHLEYGLPTRKL